MHIVIYTKSNCPNCTAAKQLLNKEKLSYTECDMDDPAIREFLMVAHPDLRQMPQIFIAGQRVGGLAGLQAYLPLLKQAQ
jgi:glutaredoxin 3